MTSKVLICQARNWKSIIVLTHALFNVYIYINIPNKWVWFILFHFLFLILLHYDKRMLLSMLAIFLEFVDIFSVAPYVVNFFQCCV